MAVWIDSGHNRWRESFKESAVAILGVIVLYELAFWKDRKQLKDWFLGAWQFLPPRSSCDAVSALGLCLAGSVVPDIFVDNPLTGASFVIARLTALKVLAKYVWLLVWPGTLSWDYSYNQVPLVRQVARQDWARFLTVGAALAIAVVLFRKNRLCFFFIGFALVAIAPVSNL